MILQTEYAAIYVMIHDTIACLEGLIQLKEEDFTSSLTQQAFSIIKVLTEVGMPVDETIIKAKIKSPEFDTQYNSFIRNVQCDVEKYQGYYDDIKDASKKRKTLEVLNQSLLAAERDNCDINALIRKVESELIGLIVDPHKASFSTLEDEAKTIVRELKNPQQMEQPCILTGFRSFDEKVRINNSDLVILAGRPSMGKAQPYHSLILTKNGWVKMGDISIGAELIDPNGQESIVENIFEQGKKQIYKITFSDGRTIECCKEHLWEVYHRKWKTPKVLQTSEIFALLQQKQYKGRLYIQYIHDTQFGEYHIFDINPWAMGILLGDGCFRKTSLEFSTKDQEVLDTMSFIFTPNYTIKHTNKYDYRILSNNKSNGLIKALKNMNLWGVKSEEKFIPIIYLQGNHNIRLSILQGLIDSDGWIEKHGTVRFSTSSKQLAVDVQYLARSLGYWARIANKQTYYTYKQEKKPGVPSYIVTICGQDTWKLSTLKRKTDNIKEKSRKNRLSFVSIEPANIEPARCIKTTSGLYITDNFTVTHNTAFALHLAMTATIKNGHDILFFSVEMPKKQIVTRIISQYCGIPLWKLLSGKGMLQDDWKRYERYEQDIINGKRCFQINDDSSLDITEMVALCKREKMRNPNIKAIFVDYLQLMQTSSDLVVETTVLSRSFKRLAKALNVPVIVLSQLSRKCEEREDKRPMLSDLRDSGSIEQDADIVMFMYRDYMYTQKEDVKNNMEIIVGKQRNGATGIHYCGFDANTQKFTEIP